jgi:hypothetical protein
MANNKKFIVKNGLESQENVVIGTTTDDGVNKLQVTGSSKFTGAVEVTQSNAATPTVKFTNSAGPSSLVAEFAGTSQSVRITNFSAGDYSILNTGQSNGIRLFNDTAGIDILYNGNTDLVFNSTGIDFKRAPTYLGNVFWNAGNDGANSGLDADLIDGLDSSQFLRSDESDTMNGSLIITGDLTVQGTTTTLSTETILLADNIITLNSNYTGSTPSENAGIEVERGTLANATFQWLEASDKWELGGPSLGLILGDTSNRQGAITSYANSFIIEAGGASGVSSGTVLLSGRLFGTAANAGVAAFHNPTTNISYGELLYNGSPRVRSDSTGITALGNSSVLGTFTVGTGSGGAYIYMDGAGTNGTIYSSAGEIGFLNSTLNYALKVDTAGDVRVTDDIFAQKFIDINNNTYQVVPSVTSVLNNIDLEGSLRHNGDTDTFITFPTTGRIGFTLDGTQYGLMTNTAFQYTGDVIADRFLDRSDNAYYVDPASSSVLNTVGIDSDLFHNGNATTKLAFGTNTIDLNTNGSSRIAITDTSVTSSVNVYAPRYYDSNNNSYYVDPALTSELNSANFYSASANNSINVGINAAQRFNIDVTSSQGYIRYIQNEIDATDHSVNFEIISSSNGLNRFNFNKNIDIGSNTITGGFGVFTSGAYASIFYDYDDENYFADLNNTGNSIKIAGTVQAGNGTLALPSYTFGSDTNTGMYRFAADTLGFSAGGNDQFRIYTTYTFSPTSSRAPIFYDSDNTTYYGDFASTSVLNRIGIDDYIQHNGNTTSYFGFSANNIYKLFTNGAERLNVDDNSADFSVDVYAPRYYDSNAITYYGDFGATSVMNRIDIDDYIRHNGNTTSYFGFSANNIYKLFTNGVERLNVDDNSADFSVDTYAPRFYTDDYLIHNGNANTYIGFDATDQFGVWTASTKRINVNTTAVAINLNTNITGALDVTGRATIGNSLTRPADLSVLTNSAARIGGSDVHLHIASLGAAANYAVALQSGRQSDNVSFPLVMQPNGGNVGVGTLTAGATLTVNKKTAQGNNPFAAGTSLFSLGDVDVVDYSIRTDASGNIYHVNDNGGNQIWYNTSASGLFGILSTGDVVVNNDSTTYAVTDAATNFIATGTASNNKLHVSGSISMGSINDVISIYGADGANTAITSATFLGVNELGFSGGGGFYMNETTTMYVRGNKALYTTGNMFAGRFYDANDNAYYADPAGTSVMNRIDIDDYIRHNGDTDNYFGFAANDTFRVFTGNTQRLNIDNDSADFAVNVYAPIFYDSDNNAYYGDFSGTSNMSRIDVDDYIRHRGNTDAYFGWAGNNNFKLFTNGTERLNIDADSADFAVNVYAPRYYDSNDSTYYVDPASVSILNNVSFGVPGNGLNVKGRFLSIEGDTDASGEGSSRIFFAEHNSTVGQQDMYGMSLAYRGGNAGINSVTGQPITLTGLSNGEWGLLGYDGSINGNWAMRGPRSAAYVEARGDFRAPVFYDSNDTNYYGDFASTSVMNVVRVNQLQVDALATFIDGRAGDYGTIRVEGTTGLDSWAGYAIRDDWVFMSNGAGTAGIYNDTDNEWALEATQNSWTRLYANGVHQLSAENGYGFAPTSMRSPIFYDSDDINYFANFAAGNINNAIKVNGRIFREGFTADAGAGNTFLLAQDENQFIWNTATNWGIFWATNTSAAFRYTPFGDNMITFVGAGNVRAAIDLDNGAGYFAGAVTAADFRINGGNEDLGLLKTYGSGLADTMLFDGTEYWEKRVIKTMQGVEDFATDTTAEYVKNNNGPFASTYALRTNQYRTFDSDYIPVEPGEQIYGEIAARYISGSGGLVYMGVRRYDKDKLPIASNDGIEYFVVGGNNLTDTNWQTFRGHTTIPTTHVPFNGSDGGACKYVRVIVLMNYPFNGGPALREYGPPILKRVNHLSNVVTDFDLSVGGNATITGDLTVDDITSDVIDANIFRDRADTAYYVDPASTTQSVRVRGEIQNPSVWINDGDNFNDYNENIRLFNAPNGVSVIAFSASGTGGTPTTSILGYSTYMERRFQNGWQERMYSGYLEAAGSYRAPIFYDSNDTNYYGDFASTSVVNVLRANQLQLDGSTYTIDSAAGDYGSIAVNGYRNGWAGYSINNQWVFMSSGPGNAGIYNDTDNKWAILTSQNADVEIFYNGTWEERSRSGYMEARGSYRAPIFYDSDNTTYLIDGNGTSRLLNLNVDNVIGGSVNGYAETLLRRDNRIIAPNTDPAGRLRFGFTSWNNNNGSPYADYLHLRSYTDASGGSDNLVMFRKDAIGMRIWQQTWNSGTAYSTVRNVAIYNENPGASNDMYASIYYDSNDTTYRVDPTDTTNIRYLKSNTSGSSSGTRALTIKDQAQPELNFGSYPGSWTSALQIQNNNNTDFVWISPLDDGQNARFRTGGANLDFYTGGGVDTGTYSAFIGDGSVRSPIFYDLDNTGYYLNLNGNSNHAGDFRTDQFYARGWFRNDNSGTGLYNQATAMHWYSDSSSRFRLYSTSSTSQILMTTSGDIARGYVYADNGNSIGFLDNGGSWKMQIVSGDWADFQGSSVRGRIFYDNQDTAYYVDPNSTARLATLGVGLAAQNGAKLSVTGGHGDSNIRVTAQGNQLGSGVTSSMHWWVSEPGVTWNEGGFGFNVTNDGGTPSGFGRPNTSYGQGYMRYTTGGDIIVYNTNTSGTRFQNMEFLSNGTVLANNYLTGGNSLRAPIFYDSQDTGYYADPNGTTRLNVTENIGRFGFSNYIVSRNEGGMMGSYNATGTADKVIWTIGESWPLGNMYGLAYSYGGFGPFGTQHKLVLRENGSTSTQFGFGGNMYVAGSGAAQNDFRAPIFYDSNDTSYYFDGASTNSTRFEGVSNRTKAMMGLPGRTGFNAEYYSARPRITGDVNYWTGSMGWGTIDMNDIAHWGSGFIDSWSNPGNQPSGTSHWVGTQAWHYTDNGNTRYGWQLVGGPIGNLRFRQSWGGFNAWRTVPMLGVNDGNGAAMYANIYYDSDNTGYYCDPSGSSNFNQDLRTNEVYTRGWHRNDNGGTGLYNQATGTHFYSSNGNEWRITGNNNGAALNIRGLADYQGTSRIWIHGATDGYQGFLNSNGSWLFRMSHNAGQSPGIWFYEAGESWTGNIGADVGKIEYHANRMYIVAGNNSDRIVQFRRDGSDTSWIANDGVFVGTATSARWADLAERYEADAIYEAGTVLAIGGDKEVTLYQPGMPLAGAISVKPAYRMNDDNYGNDNSIESKMNPFVALKGRIPVLINGSAKKGQWIIADKDGRGRAVDYGTLGINTFDIIGIAIGDSNGGEVEVKI